MYRAAVARVPNAHRVDLSLNPFPLDCLMVSLVRPAAAPVPGSMLSAIVCVGYSLFFTLPRVMGACARPAPRRLNARCLGVAPLLAFIALDLLEGFFEHPRFV